MHATSLPTLQETTVSARALRARGIARFATYCIAVLAAVLGMPSARAANRTWIGGTNAIWGDPANWSPNIEPGSGDTATFDNAGLTHTAIAIFSPITIATIVFDTASTAAYNIGGDQDTIALNSSGSITMNATVALPQHIGANLVLGTAGGADAFTFTNNSTVAGTLLIFSGTISSGANSGVKTVTVTGAGITEIHGGITNGAGSVALAKTGSGTLNLVPRVLSNSALAFNTLNAIDGTTNIDAALGSGPGTASVSVTNTPGGAPTSVRFGTVSQRLSSLTIGAGTVVTFTSGTASPFADPAGGGKEAGPPAGLVPEPGICGLLLTALLGPLLRRRRP